MIRISSGKLKGKEIKFFSKKKIRPTQAIVKKGLFSKIRFCFSNDGVKFLDLFAGSGAVGFEAYSNGADQVFWVDNDPKLILSIKKNINQLTVLGEVFLGDYKRAIEYFKRKKKKFDIIFIDPPYNYLNQSYDSVGKSRTRNFYIELLEIIITCEIILPKGWLIFERSKFYKLELNCTNNKILIEKSLILNNSKYYGDTILDFYQFIPKQIGIN